MPPRRPSPSGAPPGISRSEAFSRDPARSFREPRIRHQPPGQASEQLRNLLGGVLQVVVHRHDDAVACSADAAQQCVVLAEVAHQVDAADPVVPAGELLDHPPAAVAASVVYEDEFIARSGLFEHGPDPGHQLGQGDLAVVDRNDDRQARGTRLTIRLLRILHRGASQRITRDILRGGRVEQDIIVQLIYHDSRRKRVRRAGVRKYSGRHRRPFQG